MKTPDTQVVGKALYLEFRPTLEGVMDECRAMQFIIFPEAVVDAAVVPQKLFRRQLSDARPRATWRGTATNVTHTYGVGFEPREDVDLPNLDTPLNSDNIVTKRLQSPLFVLEQLMASNWKTYHKPIVVEVTAEDMRNVKNGKIPYKALNRILKSRPMYLYPKDVIKVD